ncbi:hypothetical protein TEA_007985 [Camellia sinensis var. sinensis]|uniref:Uncharacterized protein n=1 Tax=Camellia sinensis var. sinensis TaxID=542762 RepID=A0A4S4E404_CAMSN|nr:hypothetical protein TEA_007985 [Camellia sinensis var. sinensis]
MTIVLFFQYQEVNSLRLSNRQISLLLYSVWAQSISPANMLGNYEVIAHTYNLVLLFSHGKLLKEKGLIPEIGEQVENIVCHLDPDLQDASAAVATILREKGQSVDLVLENKPLKWGGAVFWNLFLQTYGLKAEWSGVICIVVHCIAVFCFLALQCGLCCSAGSSALLS